MNTLSNPDYLINPPLLPGVENHFRGVSRVVFDGDVPDDTKIFVPNGSIQIRGNIGNNVEIRVNGDTLGSIGLEVCGNVGDNAMFESNSSMSLCVVDNNGIFVATGGNLTLAVGGDRNRFNVFKNFEATALGDDCHVMARGGIEVITDGQNCSYTSGRGVSPLAQRIRAMATEQAGRGAGV